MFEVPSTAGPSPGMARESVVDIVPAMMERLRGALYEDADPLRGRIGRFCRNTLFLGCLF